MPFKLDREEIFNILNKRDFYIDNTILTKYLLFTKQHFLKYGQNGSKLYGNDAHINPILWQLGHVVFFYSELVLKNLDCRQFRCDNYKKLAIFYDSFKTPIENRGGNLLLPYNIIIGYYTNIIDILLEYLMVPLNTPQSYLIMLGILHNEMHNEAFIFTRLSLNNVIPFFKTSYTEEDTLVKDIKFIDYKGGLFVQGSCGKESEFLAFDNEMPKFTTKINKFGISKYPITEYMFLQFVKNGGYTTDKWWCPSGISWKTREHIELPLYWIKENDNYYKTINNTRQSIETNLPIINISYYEACAYCRWKKVRLPTESEFEYVSTNEGTTRFPWGDIKSDNTNANINYNNFVVSVKKFEKGNNHRGLGQLVGNIWEWCQEPIYPYNGFVIDPVYREMSYPFFGFKKICKGGCFAVPDFLIHPRYRNAQYPDCRIQFIGFRVCRDT